MKQRVVITGVGVISALGDSPNELHQALCAGSSALRPTLLEAGEQTLDVEAAGLSSFEARDYIEGNLRPLDRSSMLAISAAGLALADAAHEPQPEASGPTGLVLGTMFGSIHTISEFDRRGLVAGPAYTKPLVFANTVINAPAGQTAIRLGLRGVNSTIAGGSASGLQALGYAADLIAGGRKEILLAGGCEELSFEAAVGFKQSDHLAGGDESPPRAVPFDPGRNGFSLGEGAALLVLEGEETARARGARIRGSVLGFGQAFDPTRGINGQSAMDSMRRAIALALEEAKLEPNRVGCIFASANGSRRGDLAEGRALAQIFGQDSPPIGAVKSMLGECLGASGALQSVAALEGLVHGEVAGLTSLGEPEADFSTLDLGPLVRSAQEGPALITAQGLDGHAVALLLAAEEG